MECPARHPLPTRPADQFWRPTTPYQFDDGNCEAPLNASLSIYVNEQPMLPLCVQSVRAYPNVCICLKYFHLTRPTHLIPCMMETVYCGSTSLPLTLSPP